MSAMMSCDPTWATRVRAYLMGKDGLRQRTGTKANHTPLGDSSFPPGGCLAFSLQQAFARVLHPCHLPSHHLLPCFSLKRRLAL